MLISTLVLMFLFSTTLYFGSAESDFDIDWWDLDWSYRRSININSTFILGNHTDFPLFLNITDFHLAVNSHDQGDDIVFTDLNHNILDFEIISYDKTSGVLSAWVSMPVLNENYTQLYMYYGNALSVNQENIEGLWRKNYFLVYHLNSDDNFVVDSTGKNDNGTVDGVLHSIDGVIENAFDFFVRISRYDYMEGNIDAGNGSELSGFQNFTASFYVKFKDTHRRQTILNKYDIEDDERGWFVGYNDHPDFGPNLEFFASDDGGSYVDWRAPFLPTLGNWNFVAVAWASGEIPKFYVNGILMETLGDSIIFEIYNNTVPLIIGDNKYVDDRYLNGFLDEIRLTNMTRSSDWIYTEYMNMVNSSSFIQLGNIETLPVSPELFELFPFDGEIIESNLVEINFSLFDYQGDLMNYSVTTSPDIGSGSGFNVSNGFYSIPIEAAGNFGSYKWSIALTDGTNTVFHEINFKLVQSGVDVIPPVADAGDDVIIDEDFVVPFDAFGSYDNVGIWDYTWSFYDGSSQILKGLNPEYLFAEPGEYAVLLVVTDYSGYQDDDVVIVTVNDVTNPSAVAGDDLTINVNELFSLDASKSSDNVKIFRYRWNMGNDKIKTGVNIEYSYSNPGTYNVTLTVFDSDNNFNVDYILVEVLPPEGEDFFVLLIFIIFILVVIIIGYRFFLSKIGKKDEADGKSIYRLP